MEISHKQLSEGLLDDTDNVRISASSFATNMVVKQNAIDYSHEFTMAAEVVHVILC